MTRTIHYTRVEAATLERDASRVFDGAAEEAQVLEHIGRTAYAAATEDAFQDADDADLDQRASQLSGCALHALSVALGLATHAGRLRQLADIRRADIDRLSDDE